MRCILCFLVTPRVTFSSMLARFLLISTFAFCCLSSRQVCSFTFFLCVDRSICLTETFAYVTCLLTICDLVLISYFVTFTSLCNRVFFSFTNTLCLSDVSPIFIPLSRCTHDVTDKEKEKNTQSIFDRERLPTCIDMCIMHMCRS